MGQAEADFSPARRRLLLLALAGAALIVPARGRPGANGGNDPWLEALVGDLGRARRIGEAFLRLYPQERSAPALLASLFGFSTVEECLRAGPAALRRRLRARRNADFRQGNLVLLEGWAFARTEARLTALAALLQGR